MTGSPTDTMQAPDAPFDVEVVVALVLSAGLADDADTARLLVDLDVVRVDALESDTTKCLVNVNGRQAVVAAPGSN